MAVSARVRKFKPELLNQKVDDLLVGAAPKDIPKLRKAAIKWLRSGDGLTKYVDGKISITPDSATQIAYVAKRLRLMKQSELSPALEKLATRIRTSISDGVEFSVLYDLCKKFGSEKRKADLGKGKAKPEAVAPIRVKKIDPGSAKPNQNTNDEIKVLRKALGKAEKRVAAMELKQSEIHSILFEHLEAWSVRMSSALSKLVQRVIEHDQAIRNLGITQGINDVGPQEEISIPSGIGLIVDRGGALPIDGNAATTFRRSR